MKKKTVEEIHIHVNLEAYCILNKKKYDTCMMI